MICSPAGVTGFVWPGRSAAEVALRVRRLAPRAKQISPARLPGGLAGKLSDYFAGRPADFADVPLDLTGHPPFRVKVLNALRGIRYGRTISYGELAAKVGKPAASRAVGQAVGANPIPVIVPCHRVLRSDGGLGGFSADEGVSLKRRLLDMERTSVE